MADTQQEVQIDARLRDVLADVLQVSPGRVADDLAMADVETWDSLTHMDLVVSIEKLYGIELTFEEIVAMQSVGEIRRVLQERRIRA